MLHQERPRESRDLPVVRQPLTQAARLALHGNGFVARRMQGCEHGIDHGRRILVPDTERIARAVLEARAGERDLESERPLPAVARCRRHAAQPRDVGRLRGTERVARAAHDLLEPRRRQPFVVHVAIDARQQPLRAQHCEPLVHLASRLAELRIAGVAERQHGVLELRHLRRALAEQVFDEAASVVRRVTVAVRAHDDGQQALVGQVAQRVVACGVHPHRDAGGLGRLAEPLGDAPAVAGLRAVDDREAARRPLPVCEP